MIEISPSDFVLPPYPYQMAGIKHIISRPFAAVFDEQGVGKTKQTIDACSILFQNKQIDMVIIVAPNSVRGVWDNNDTGEIKKHCHSDYIVIRYDNSFKAKALPIVNNQLLWVTISYSFLRARLKKFLELVKSSGKRFMLVLDESSFVKSYKAQQTDACWQLRQFCTRCVILNGTPYGDNILDYWSQFNILDPTAIRNMNYYHFRAKYAILASGENKRLGTTFNKVVGFNTEEVEKLKTQLAPWIIRREKVDVLPDLPPKLPPVYIEAALSKSAWQQYLDMKNELVAWIDNDVHSQASNAAVKVGRLSQITSGFLGGLKDVNTGELTEESSLIKEIDDGKLNAFLEFWETNRDKQILVWCRFRAEMFRLFDKLKELGGNPGLIIGGQVDTDRQSSIDGFKTGKVDTLIGNAGAGGFGLTLTNCHTVVYMSLDHSLIKFQQSSDRVHRPGQQMPCSYYFIVGTGPNRERTIDSTIIKAVLNKEEMAKWTMNKWREAILNP